MTVYQKILDKSKEIDKKFEKISDSELDNLKIVFNIPKSHPRSNKIPNYVYSSNPLNNLIKTPEYNLTPNHIFIIDAQVNKIKFVKEFIKKNKIKSIILNSTEYEVKTKHFIEDLIKKHSLNKTRDTTLVVLGGGLLLNVTAYIAEKISANVIQFPTTVLAMADSAGGKVRVNLITKTKSYKHFYKSFYEPNVMFLDDRFLDFLPEDQIKIGLVEIIKHGIFQSPKLYNYLLTSEKELLTDKHKLKKAILWAVSLKNICLDIDSEETKNGSEKILRAGHDISDKLEEDKKLNIPHGIAVAIGIIKQLQLEQKAELLKKAKIIFDLLDIPYSTEAFNK